LQTSGVGARNRFQGHTRIRVIEAPYIDRVKMNGGPCFGGNSCGWCGSPYQNILCRPRGKKSLPRSHAEAPYIDRVKTLCQISVIVFRR